MKMKSSQFPRQRQFLFLWCDDQIANCKKKNADTIVGRENDDGAMLAHAKKFIEKVRDPTLSKWMPNFHTNSEKLICAFSLITFVLGVKKKEAKYL